MKKSKRSDYLVITDDRVRVSYNLFEDGSLGHHFDLTEQQALALGKALLKHIPHMRKKFKNRKQRLGYFVHFNPEVSFFIHGRKS
jgi:hypothetical protein